MNRIKEYAVVVSGLIVLTAIAVIFYAMAYMRSGHPPASGIVALIVMFIVSPISFMAFLLGMTIPASTMKLKPRWVYSMWGVNLAFLFIVACIFVFRVLLGRPI